MPAVQSVIPRPYPFRIGFYTHTLLSIIFWDCFPICQWCSPYLVVSVACAAAYHLPVHMLESVPLQYSLSAISIECHHFLARYSSTFLIQI